MSTEDEEAEEQVVGVLKPCEVCEAKTVHVGGVCRDHQVVRRRKVAVAAAAAPVVAAAPPVRRVKKRPPPPRTHRLRNAILGLLLVGLVVGAGFIHVVRGSDISVHVCAKHGWSLADTYVNLDDYRLGSDTMSMKLGTALEECELY